MKKKSEDEKAHDRAILAARVAIENLPISDEEKLVAVGMAYDRFKSISIELAEGDASQATVSAVLLAALTYCRVYWPTPSTATVIDSFTLTGGVTHPRVVKDGVKIDKPTKLKLTANVRNTPGIETWQSVAKRAADSLPKIPPPK